MQIAAAAAIIIALVIGARRWIHHAQLELVPIIVVPGADAQAVVSPPAGAIAIRMFRDVHEALSRPQRPKLAVLTFDDGPYPVDTPALAAVLAQLHVPADFFFIGNDAMRQPAIAARLPGSAFEVGNHSMTHPEMPALSYYAQRAEIVKGAEAIARVTNQPVALFRPPHGNYDAATIKAAGDAGETVVLWDVDPGDWRTLSPDQIADLAARQARAPAVILLHNGKESTVEALPRIVASYRKAGFIFVTLTELVRRVPLDQINDPVKVEL